MPNPCQKMHVALDIATYDTWKGRGEESEREEGRRGEVEGQREEREREGRGEREREGYR